jgi:hypothetical protein
VGYHGIHVACPDKEGQSGYSQGKIMVRVRPIRLGNDTYPIPVGFENSPDYRCGKGWMVHIGIP